MGVSGDLETFCENDREVKPDDDQVGDGDVGLLYGAWGSGTAGSVMRSNPRYRNPIRRTPRKSEVNKLNRESRRSKLESCISCC